MAGLILAAAILPPCEALAATKRKSASGPNPRYAAIVIDADTGAVLHERYADKRLHPASLVKMMTLLMTFEALQNGSLTLSSRVKISAHAAAQQPSKLGLPVGSSIAVKDAIYALVTKSANDIAVALGETVGGSESRFVSMMNAKAQSIGMTQTNFRNASGLHNPAQVSSARDMARLSRHLIKAYPEQYRYFSKKNFSYNGVSHRNHNRLMETYRGMDGIKTGYIGPSGFNLAASAVRDGHRLIAVVFGGRSTQSRNDHVAELLDSGFVKLGKGVGTLVANMDDDIAPEPARRIAAPLPQRKPAPPAPADTSVSIAALDPSVRNADSVPMTPDAIREMIGEGDYDPEVARRFETGMMAIAALKNDMTEPASGIPAAPPPAAGTLPAKAAFVPEPQTQPSDWAVQIGAFTSRVKGDEALNNAMAKLPPKFRGLAKPVIVPLKAGDAFVFRARLRGLSREQAMAACRHLSNCMAISPRAF